jgi:hypothetical protein
MSIFDEGLLISINLKHCQFQFYWLGKDIVLRFIIEF